MIMENKPHILFRSESDTKDYVILIFWVTNYDDIRCNIQENTKVIKKEVLTDRFQLRFKVENIPSARRFIFYMLNNYFTLSFQNYEECHLLSQEHKQLKAFLTLLEKHNITTPKKRKLTKTIPLMDAELSQTVAQSLEDYI